MVQAVFMVMFSFSSDLFLNRVQSTRGCFVFCFVLRSFSLCSRFSSATWLDRSFFLWTVRCEMLEAFLSREFILIGGFNVG